MSRPTLWLVLAALALLSAGCRLQLAMDVAIGRDGSGVVELAVGLDQELLTLLTDAGFDPAVGLDELARSAPQWEFEDLSSEGGLTYTFRTDFDDPGHFAELMDELESGTGAGDPALFDDLEIVVEDDGSVVVRGDAGLLLPDTTGVEGADIAFDADDLETLLDERGQEFVRNELRVTLPAEPLEHDADVRDGNTLTWQLPVGETRPVSARSAPTPDRTLLIAAAVALLVAVAAATATFLVRRRARRR